MLPSNDKRMYRLMWGIYEVSSLEGFSCRDINTKTLNRVGQRFTCRQHSDLISILSFLAYFHYFENIKVALSDNDYGVMVNFATYRSLTARSTVFLHCRAINILGHLQMVEATTRLTIFLQTGEGFQYTLMSDQSRHQIVILTIVWWWQNLVRD
jgi:hypothetical protein